MNSHSTRRRFLRNAALGAQLAGAAPRFLAATLDQLRRESGGRGAEAPILVVLQLAGGNDGLNMAAPFSDDHYRRARPSLSLGPGQVLKLDDRTGLHPALTGLKRLWDDGRLGIVQAVGYPRPNRSHFRSTDIWMTATDSDRTGDRGWLGSYWRHGGAGDDPTAGVAVGRRAPLAFAGAGPCALAFENPDAIAFGPGDDDGGGNAEGLAAYRRLSEGESAGMSGAQVMAAPAAGPSPASPIEFLERTAAGADSGLQRIRAASARGRNHADYPATRLAADLKLIARLIAGGMSTRIYFASHGGYDTHAAQAPAQHRLFDELGGALSAFIADLERMGALDRVLVMTFSEFGRRVAENASGGTDHGAAAPLILAGGAVRPGLHGEAPSLAPGDLVNGDVAHRIDFREVYAGVLEGWLKTRSGPILGRSFRPFPVV